MLAPTLRLEPCSSFDSQMDEPVVCARCGWLGHEHEQVPVAAVAVRRPRAA